jgi:hypothetical protein
VGCKSLNVDLLNGKKKYLTFSTFLDATDAQRYPFLAY